MPAEQAVTTHNVHRAAPCGAILSAGSTASGAACPRAWCDDVTPRVHHERRSSAPDTAHAAQHEHGQQYDHVKDERQRRRNHAGPEGAVSGAPTYRDRSNRHKKETFALPTRTWLSNSLHSRAV